MRFLFAVLCLAAATTSAVACDICAVYAAEQARESKAGWSAGVFEQFTYFGRLQEDGESAPNPTGQWLDSSVTQLLAGYRFNERVGVQLNVPMIYRWYRRPEGFEIEKGTVSGIGDVSLIARVRVFERFDDDTAVTLDALGGVKFPTGDSDRLKEEQNEVEIPGAPESGIHGHDLALGSGSFDGIAGGALFTRWKRLFGTASLQYSIRTEGDFNYQYANDLTWNGGPGVLVVMSHTGTVGVQFNVAGESKGNDKNDGHDTTDTGITSVYVGPAITATWHDHFSGEVAADLPVYQNNTSLQAVPDYRVRLGLMWRF